MNMMKGVLKLKEKRYVTPHYLRVVLEGEELENFKDARVGDNNKLAIPKDKNVPLSLEESANPNYTIRTYTLKGLDLEKGEMTIDFVTHGDVGVASLWAINAEKGDEIGVFMKAKTKPFYQLADWYCFVGDHPALPVISTILELLPEDAVGSVILEVYGHEDVIELQKPKNIEITWLFNSTPGQNSTLVEKFSDFDLNAHKKPFIFVAAEYNSVKAIQKILRNIENLERKQWYAYSYWKYGQAEDKSKFQRKELKSQE